MRKRWIVLLVSALILVALAGAFWPVEALVLDDPDHRAVLALL